MNLDIAQATRVYDAAARAKADRLLTDHQGIQTFVRSVAVFGRRLGENAQDEFWKPVLRALRRVQYDVTSVPLPLNHASLALKDSAGLLEQRLGHVEALFPTIAPAASAVVQQIAELATRQEDPLTDAVASVLEDEQPHDLRHAVLLRSTHHALAVREHLRDRQISARPLTAEALTGDLVAWHLVAVGPRRWFPPFVIAAPRALALTFVHFRWIRDSEPEDQAFPAVFPGTRKSSIGTHSKSAPVDETALLIDAEALLPVIDWHAISRAAITPPEDPDVANASLFLLADGFAVYLDARQGSRAYIVDPDAEDDMRVRQEPLTQIGPGSFLLLRRGGGGDYIRPIADQILRENASAVRALQMEWKQLLNEKVRVLGPWAVAERLRTLGLASATDMNVRYWSSFDTIATGDVGDFMAIMKLIGLTERTEELWSSMQLIRAAHVRAGQHIRKLLSREVLAASSVELRERGVTHFELEELGGGTLSVFRVAAKSPKLVPVARSHLRHPFAVGRDLWHG